MILTNVGLSSVFMVAGAGGVGFTPHVIHVDAGEVCGFFSLLVWMVLNGEECGH